VRGALGGRCVGQRLRRQAESRGHAGHPGQRGPSDARHSARDSDTGLLPVAAQRAPFRAGRAHQEGCPTRGQPSERLTSGQPNRFRPVISVKYARTRQIGFWLLNCQINATGDTGLTLISAVLCNFVPFLRGNGDSQSQEAFVTRVRGGLARTDSPCRLRGGRPSRPRGAARGGIRPGVSRSRSETTAGLALSRARTRIQITRTTRRVLPLRPRLFATMFDRRIFLPNGP